MSIIVTSDVAQDRRGPASGGDSQGQRSSQEQDCTKHPSGTHHRAPMHASPPRQTSTSVSTSSHREASGSPHCTSLEERRSSSRTSSSRGETQRHRDGANASAGHQRKDTTTPEVIFCGATLSEGKGQRRTSLSDATVFATATTTARPIRAADSCQAHPLSASPGGVPNGETGHHGEHPSHESHPVPRSLMQCIKADQNASTSGIQVAEGGNDGQGRNGGYRQCASDRRGAVEMSSGVEGEGTAASRPHARKARSPANQSRVNLYVRDLPLDFDEETLRMVFSQFGEIVNSAIMRNILTGVSLGTAFVRFSQHEEALRAMDFFSTGGVTVGSKTITVQWARREHDRAPAGDERRRMRKVFIRNVPKDVTNDMLLELFQRFGPIKSVTMHRDTVAVSALRLASVSRMSSDPASLDAAQLAAVADDRRIAFITFQEEGVAERATAMVHNTFPFESCRDIPLMVKLAEDAPTRHGTSAGTGSQRLTSKSTVASAAASAVDGGHLGAVGHRCSTQTCSGGSMTNLTSVTVGRPASQIMNSSDFPGMEYFATPTASPPLIQLHPPMEMPASAMNNLHSDPVLWSVAGGTEYALDISQVRSDGGAAMSRSTPYLTTGRVVSGFSLNGVSTPAFAGLSPQSSFSTMPSPQGRLSEAQHQLTQPAQRMSSTATQQKPILVERLAPQNLVRGTAMDQVPEEAPTSISFPFVTPHHSGGYTHGRGGASQDFLRMVGPDAPVTYPVSTLSGADHTTDRHQLSSDRTVASNRGGIDCVGAFSQTALPPHQAMPTISISHADRMRGIEGRDLSSGKPTFSTAEVTPQGTRDTTSPTSPASPHLLPKPPQAVPPPLGVSSHSPLKQSSCTPPTDSTPADNVPTHSSQAPSVLIPQPRSTAKTTSSSQSKPAAPTASVRTPHPSVGPLEAGKQLCLSAPSSLPASACQQQQSIARTFVRETTAGSVSNPLEKGSDQSANVALPVPGALASRNGPAAGVPPLHGRQFAGTSPPNASHWNSDPSSAVGAIPLSSLNNSTSGSDRNTIYFDAAPPFSSPENFTPVNFGGYAAIDRAGGYTVVYGVPHTRPIFLTQYCPEGGSVQPTQLLQPAYALMTDLLMPAASPNVADLHFPEALLTNGPSNEPSDAGLCKPVKVVDAEGSEAQLSSYGHGPASVNDSEAYHLCGISESTSGHLNYRPRSSSTATIVPSEEEPIRDARLEPLPWSPLADPEACNGKGKDATFSEQTTRSHASISTTATGREEYALPALADAGTDRKPSMTSGDEGGPLPPPLRPEDLAVPNNTLSTSPTYNSSLQNDIALRSSTAKDEGVAPTVCGESSCDGRDVTPGAPNSNSLNLMPSVRIESASGVADQTAYDMDADVPLFQPALLSDAEEDEETAWSIYPDLSLNLGWPVESKRESPSVERAVGGRCDITNHGASKCRCCGQKLGFETKNVFHSFLYDDAP